MSFGAAGFLWGLLAIGLPILIHLIFRRRFRRVRWAAMEFLLRAVKKTRSRLLLENLLLLLVRIAIVALLALAFSKIHFGTSKAYDSETEDDRPVHLLLVVDNSYSMGASQMGSQEDLLTRAKVLAAERIGRLRSERADTVTLFASARGGSIVEGIRFSTDLKAAKMAVAAIGLSHFPSDVARLLATLGSFIDEDRLEEGSGTQHPGKILVFVTDLQQWAWVSGGREGSEFHKLLQDVSRSCRRFDLVEVDAAKQRPGNLAIENLSAAAKVVGGGLKTRFVATLRNFGEQEARGLNLDFLVDGEKKDFRLGLVVPPGKELDVGFNHIFQEPGKHHVAVVLEAKGGAVRQLDRLELDNRRFYTFEARDSINVLLVDGDPGERTVDSEVFHLRMALLPYRPDETPDEWILHPEVVEIIPPLEKLLRSDVVILANVGQFSESDGENLRTLVRRGGSLVLFLGDLVRPGNYNQRLFGRPDDALLPAPLRGPARQGVEFSQDDAVHLVVEESAYEHPMFDYFRDNESLQGLFQQTLTLNYHQLDLERMVSSGRILARFNDVAQSPAFVEGRYGRGRVVLITTSADRHWSFLSSSVVWVPLLHESILYLAHRTAGSTNVKVGEKFRGRYPFFTKEGPRHFPPELEGLRRGLPGRKVVRRLARDYDPLKEETKVVFAETDRAGVSALQFEEVRRTGDGSSGVPTTYQDYLAVNLDQRESDLARITQEDLRQTFPGVLFGVTREDSAEELHEEEDRLWWWVFLVILGLILVESLLALLFGARHR